VVPDCYLLANSHGVALLDAVTDWRTGVTAVPELKPQYGEAFQLWFSGKIPPKPIPVSIVDPEVGLSRLVAWIVPLEGSANPWIAFAPTGAGPAGAMRPAPGFLSVLQTWRGTGVPVVSMIYGNEHAGAMVSKWPPYDFVDCDVAEVQPAVPIIDTAAIDTLVMRWIFLVVSVLSVVRQRTGAPMVHVLPPPPREHPERATHLETLGEDLRTCGFTRAALRLKWYRRYCRLLSARLALFNCDVLSPPAAACSADGLLQDDFAEGLTHGNRRYGRLVAEQIASWLARAA
jgi:hypothetical protein